MFIWNPSKRTRYTVRTILSAEECAHRILDTMNDYNAQARGRYLMATAFGERFTAQLEPGTLGSRGSGTFMKHFVVQVTGVFGPMRDGTVAVTIGFRRSTSLAQVVIRLGLAGIIALAVWTLVASPIVPVFSVAFGIGIAPLLLLWSLVAFVQGMRQAGKDWTALLLFVQTALGSHSMEQV